MLPAFLTTVLFSISAVCAQRTSRALGGVDANFWRVILAALVLALWAHTAGQGLSGVAFPLFLWSGLLGFGFGDVALYQALPRIGSRLSILLVHCLAAPVAAVVEWLWLGSRMNAAEIAGAALILTGVAIALAPGKGFHIERGHFWTGVGFGVVAAVGQGLGAVVSGHASRVDARAGTPIDGLTAAYQRIIAGVVVGAVFWAVMKWRRSNGGGMTANEMRSTLPSRSLWPWIVANALSGPAIGVGCYQWALMTEKSGVVLPIVALTPLVIIPFSRFVEGERPRKRSLAGGVVAVAGVFILADGLALVRGWVR